MWCWGQNGEEVGAPFGRLGVFFSRKFQNFQMWSLIMDHNKGFWGKTWKKFTFVNLYFVLGTGVNSWREWLPAWSFSSFCLLALRVLWTCEPPLVRRKDSERQKQWEGGLGMLMEEIQTTTKVENKKWKWEIKHRKNCECCPRHSLFKSHKVFVY